VFLDKTQLEVFEVINERGVIGLGHLLLLTPGRIRI
jgi:hypothetical protein